MMYMKLQLGKSQEILPPWMRERIDRNRRKDNQLPLELPLIEPPINYPKKDDEEPHKRGVVIIQL